MATQNERLIGVESCAVSVLKRAVEHDTANKYTSALTCYQEGIELLLEVLKGTTDEVKRNHIRARIKSYMDRGEEIKRLIQKEKDAGTYNEKINIPEGGKGYGYEKLFGHLMDSSVRQADVEDPYIRSNHQIQNLVRLCELLVTRCSNLKRINLLTKADDRGSSNKDQVDKIRCLAESLKERDVILHVTYSPTLHDREIRLDNGWVIKIGRGLDYFKATQNFYSLGCFDMNLRECHETTVNIFHRKYLKTV